MVCSIQAKRKEPHKNVFIQTAVNNDFNVLINLQFKLILLIKIVFIASKYITTARSSIMKESVWRLT